MTNESKKPGRPLKYTHFLTELEDDEVYSPGTIAQLGQDLGFLDDVKQEEKKDARLLVRHTLARYRFNHDFPEDGDGTVKIRGQGASLGWTGERWKADMEEADLERGGTEAKRLKQLHNSKGRVTNATSATDE